VAMATGVVQSPLNEYVQFNGRYKIATHSRELTA
jgi:hypothetical protein